MRKKRDTLSNSALLHSALCDLKLDLSLDSFLAASMPGNTPCLGICPQSIPEPYHSLQLDICSRCPTWALSDLYRTCKFFPLKVCKTWKRDSSSSSPQSSHSLASNFCNLIPALLSAQGTVYSFDCPNYLLTDWKDPESQPPNPERNPLFFSLPCKSSYLELQFPTLASSLRADFSPPKATLHSVLQDRKERHHMFLKLKRKHSTLEKP